MTNETTPSINQINVISSIGAIGAFEWCALITLLPTLLTLSKFERFEVYHLSAYTEIQGAYNNGNILRILLNWLNLFNFKLVQQHNGK